MKRTGAPPAADASELDQAASRLPAGHHRKYRTVNSVPPRGPGVIAHIAAKLVANSGRGMHHGRTGMRFPN